MPQEAKIFIVDDSEGVRDSLKMFLEEAGHEVVMEASTLKEAMDKVELIKEKGVDVALLDGSLSKSGPPSQDGPFIAGALKGKAPECKIVSISGDEDFDWGSVELDANPGKDFEKVKKIGEIVDRL